MKVPNHHCMARGRCTFKAICFPSTSTHVLSRYQFGKPADSPYLTQPTVQHDYTTLPQHLQPQQTAPCCPVPTAVPGAGSSNHLACSSDTRQPILHRLGVPRQGYALLTGSKHIHSSTPCQATCSTASQSMLRPHIGQCKCVRSCKTHSLASWRQRVATTVHARLHAMPGCCSSQSQVLWQCCTKVHQKYGRCPATHPAAEATHGTISSCQQHLIMQRGPHPTKQCRSCGKLQATWPQITRCLHNYAAPASQ